MDDSSVSGMRSLSQMFAQQPPEEVEVCHGTEGLSGRLYHCYCCCNSTLTCITCHASLKSNPLFVCLFKTERAYSFCGTIEYMAPDIVRGGDSGHDKVCSTFDTTLCISVNCAGRVNPS